MRLMIRLSAALLVFWTSCSPSGPCVFAQQTAELRVSVGAVTKYSGAPSSSDRQRCQDFLDLLETQLATEFLKSPEVDYLDRSSLDEIFQELHVSSDVAFDQSSGPLRGLLGRLDFLIVATASSPTSARVRVLDVETGAVKVVAVCERRTSIFASRSAAAPECIASIVSQTQSVVKTRLAVKRQRLMKAAVAKRAAQEQRTKLAQREREEVRKRAQREKEEETRRAQEEQTAAQQRAEEERAAQQRQAEIEDQINAARPKYEDAITRLSAQTTFWKKIDGELRSRGFSLRSDVQSALKSAQLTADRCGEFLTAGKPDALNTCINELSQELDRLEKYRQ